MNERRYFKERLLVAIKNCKVLCRIGLNIVQSLAVVTVVKYAVLKEWRIACAYFLIMGSFCYASYYVHVVGCYFLLLVFIVIF